MMPGVAAPHCYVLERESDWEVTMKIDSTICGAITIDGKTYEHDVVVRLSGEVVKRKKKLSKKLYGTSHVLSKDEAKFSLREGVRPGCHRLGSDGQRASVSGGGSLFRKKALRGRVDADTRGDSVVQPLARKEDRALSRDLLKEMHW